MDEWITDWEFNITDDWHFKFNLCSFVSFPNVSHTSKKSTNLRFSTQIRESGSLKEIYQWQKENKCRPDDRPLVFPSNLAPPQQLVKEADVHAVFINILSRRTNLRVNAGNASLFPSLNFYYKHINSCLTGCWHAPHVLLGLMKLLAHKKDHS